MARGFLREFFAQYKSLPCLWNRRDPKFCDKFQNDLAIMELTKMYRELSPNATQVSVRRELVTFNASLKKEHKRRKMALKTGLPLDSEFQYYDDLSFLLSNNVTKPKVIQKEEKWKLAGLNDNIKTAKRDGDGKTKLMPKRRIAAKKPSMKDKYDVLAEKLRSLPMEQFSYIENTLENVFKFAEYTKSGWIKTSSTITKTQEAPKHDGANTKTVQSKSVISQGTQEMRSRPVRTQAAAAPTTTNSPSRPSYPIIIDYQQLTRSSPTTASRQYGGGTPIRAIAKTVQSKTVGSRSSQEMLSRAVGARMASPYSMFRNNWWCSLDF